jgi:2-keto-4-pentenoate hydratase/2-oxohepta-3-ene-1,7-dioic acid hydratase in catechol pathway
MLNGRDDGHYETELALLIGKKLHVNKSGHDILTCYRSVAGLGAALDLTLKTLQSELKARGAPWPMGDLFKG